MLKVSLNTRLNTFELDADFIGESGKTTVLLGESGAGKSTVLRALAGILTPQHGHISLENEVYFDSERRINVPPQLRPFGYVFQDYILFPHLTVFENVAFGLRAQRMPGGEIKRRVSEALAQVRLVGLEKRRPGQLSGGQQQRVSIARALALRPRMLLLDEPLSALDVQTRREVRQELKRILTELEVTTVMVTHQYLEALIFGHQIVVIDGGHVAQQGSPKDLLERPRSSYIAELAGMNYFQGKLVRYEGDAMAVIRVEDGAAPFEIVALLQEQTLEEGIIGREVYVIVDPHSVALYQSMPNTSMRNILHGEVVQILYVGSHMEQNGEGTVRVGVQIDSALPPLTAEITASSAVRMELHEGMRLYVAFKATETQAYL